MVPASSPGPASPSGFWCSSASSFTAAPSSFTHEGKTVTQYFRLVGQGDAPGACGLLDKYAQAKLTLVEKTETCEAAITKVHKALTTAERSSLVDGPFIKGSELSGGHKVINVSDNPLYMATITLIERQGRELIHDWS